MRVSVFKRPIVAAFALAIALGMSASTGVQGQQTSFSDKPCTEGNEVKLKGPAGIPQSDIQFDVVTTHYPVRGADYVQAYRGLGAPHGGGFAGWARWNVSYNFDTLPRAEGCSVDRVHIRITGQIMMPKWEALADATLRDQAYWHAMYAQLKRHEDGHIQNGRDFALLLRERLLGIGTVPCDSIQATASQVYRTLQAGLQNRDADYDRRTRHGLRQDNPD
jgi:predicted secreted Zn-dependent protease